MSIQESKQRDTTIIIHILRTFREELKCGWLNPKSDYAIVRYYECWHFIHGYYMGSQTCTYSKCLTAEHYLDNLAKQYNLTV